MSNVVNLPSGYVKVEYLRSTGTQYIMTDYLVDTDISVFEIDMKEGNVTGDNMMFGVSDSGYGVWMETYNTYNNYASMGKNSSYDRLSDTIIDGIIQFNIPEGKLFYPDGTMFDITSRLSRKYTEPLCIFARNRYGITPGIQYPHKDLYIRNFIIIENGEIIKNYVPCLDNTGKPCFYDTVNRIPYFNAGTGEFLYGDIMIKN